MKISFIKYKDGNNYQIPKVLGMDIQEVSDPEKIDLKIEELKRDNYTTIFVTSELASFSEKINEYKYDNLINIVIIPSKRDC